MAATMLRAAEVNLYFWNRHNGAWKRLHNFLRLILQRFFAYNIRYCAIINFINMRFAFLMRLYILKRVQVVVLHSASPILSRYSHAQVFIIKKMIWRKKVMILAQSGIAKQKQVHLYAFWMIAVLPLRIYKKRLRIVGYTERLYLIPRSARPTRWI